MSTATRTVTGAHFEELMKGVDDDIRQIMEDNLVFFTNDSDTSAMAEKSRSDKLRAAYTKLADFITQKLLNDLNNQQKAFLCCGAIGDTVTVQAEGGPKVLNLLPKDFYESLLKTFSVLSPEGRLTSSPPSPRASWSPSRPARIATGTCAVPPPTSAASARSGNAR
jgi:hypothetical protein